MDTISDDVNLVVQSAFQFALTDRLSLNDKDLVQVITSIDGSHTARSLRMVVAKERAYPLNETVLSQLFASSKESSSDIYASVEVRSWSPSLRIAEDVRTKLNFLSLKETRKLYLTSSKEILGYPVPFHFCTDFLLHSSTIRSYLLLG